LIIEICEHADTMLDFDRFVSALGPHAGKYTPVELRQLYAEVHQVAELLLNLHRREGARTGQRSPQSTVDGSRIDRTMQISLMPRDDASAPSADPP
jgi:hypothetical protein